jgi:hypothetical protein
MNSQILSHRRPAAAALTAAMLMVLSPIAVFSQVNNVSVRGSFDAHGIGIVQGGTLQAADSGSGNASQIGRFTFFWNATVDLASGNGRGVFLLVFSNGDVIYGSLYGQSDPPNTPNLGHDVDDMTINGGTGRFQGATGSLRFDRQIDLSTLPAFESSLGTVTGTIRAPGLRQGVGN